MCGCDFSGDGDGGNPSAWGIAEYRDGEIFDGGCCATQAGVKIPVCGFEVGSVTDSENAF